MPVPLITPTQTIDLSPTKSCANCKWKFTQQGSPFCRRNPPQVTQIVVGVNELRQPKIQPYSGFPVVRDEWVCGEHTTRLVS